MRRINVKLWVGLLASAVVLGLPGHAYAAVHRPEPPSKLWLIKSNDLQVVGTQYRPLFRWVACGVATGMGCHRGQVPTFASYWALKRAIADGRITSGRTILFDQEGWSATPPQERANPALYAALIGKLCWHYRIRLIFTGVEPGMQAELNVYDAAAPWAYAIGVQTQRYDADPAQFLQYASRAAKQLRSVNPSVKVMIGLAPDAGGIPVSDGVMVTEYRETYPLADGFWLNSAVWAPPRGIGCAPVGCGWTADLFLFDIGYPPDFQG
jgi:hypothetical protein